MQRYRAALTATYAGLTAICFYSQPVRADDHACQVLLCLANPGGATQYAECVPPITKLYQDLAKGKPFPVCAGAGGIETSQPVIDPYECKAGFILDYREKGPICRTPARTQTVECPLPDAEPKPHDPVPAEPGSKQCVDFDFSQVVVRDKQQYIDVTISATGKKTRIWF